MKYICNGEQINLLRLFVESAIYEMNNKDEKAKEFFKIALRLNPVNYNIRKKLNKNDPSKDVTNLIKFEKMEDYLKMETPNEVKDKFPIHYLFDETYKIVYPEGASEEYCHFAIRILNKDGIDRCKEINVGEDTYAKYFKIENAQVYKKSGTKFKADVSGNDVVFPNLEVGDIVYVKYKIEYYFQGKFARDFFESFSCQTLYPTTLMRHSFIVAKNINFNIKEKNGKQEYSKEDLGEFNAWHWVQKNNPGFVREPYMPASKDFLPTTEISTLKSWNDIAQWYSDVSLLQSEPGERIKAVVQDLMSKNPKANNKEKAKIIYEYILKNIRYSSIPFRQSALVPQKAELVIESKLGDCKDLSTLFVSMCKVANIDANLVLVATNDDGFYQMDLPSINFNHCIVRLNVEQKPIYLELTNPFLAFGASQFNLEGAQFLNIPRKVEPSYQAKIENFDFSNAIQSRVHRSSKISVKENNLNVNVKSTKFGYSASSSRRVFSELDEEKTRKKMKELVSYGVVNTVVLNDVKFQNLDNISDSLVYLYDYDIKNEVLKLGSMAGFKIPYADVPFDSKSFEQETRKYPICYLDFHDEKTIIEEMIIEIPTGKVIVDTPKNIDLKFETLQYVVKFEKLSDTKLKLTRQISQNQYFVQPEKYQEFKSFLQKIVDFEAEYITFK